MFKTEPLEEVRLFVIDIGAFVSVYRDTLFGTKSELIVARNINLTEKLWIKRQHATFFHILGKARVVIDVFTFIR